MENVSTRFRVRVPASTSNLGPGFDLLGLAVSLWLELEVEVRPGPHAFAELQGTATEWPRNDNLITRAFDVGIDALDEPGVGLRVNARSEIPLGRGLGSSGAAIAAGLALAATWTGGTKTDDPRLCELGCAIDGHPDNTTASLIGGCTLAMPHGSGLAVVKQPLHSTLGFAVAWPAQTQATAEARSCLPATVPFSDAVENPRRLALLLEGLRAADPSLLSLGIEDRLHVRHRLDMIENGRSALSAARDAGAWASTVSGSGSALIALGPRGAMDGIAAAMAEALGTDREAATGRVVEAVYGSPRVERLDESS